MIFENLLISQNFKNFKSCEIFKFYGFWKFWKNNTKKQKNFSFFTKILIFLREKYKNSTHDVICRARGRFNLKNMWFWTVSKGYPLWKLFKITCPGPGFWSICRARLRFYVSKTGDPEAGIRKMIGKRLYKGKKSQKVIIMWSFFMIFMNFMILDKKVIKTEKNENTEKFYGKHKIYFKKQKYH